MLFPDITVCNLNSIATHSSDNNGYRNYVAAMEKVCLQLTLHRGNKISQAILRNLNFWQFL